MPRSRSLRQMVYEQSLRNSQSPFMAGAGMTGRDRRRRTPTADQMPGGSSALGDSVRSWAKERAAEEFGKTDLGQQVGRGVQNILGTGPQHAEALPRVGTSAASAAGEGFKSAGVGLTGPQATTAAQAGAGPVSGTAGAQAGMLGSNAAAMAQGVGKAVLAKLLARFI